MVAVGPPTRPPLSEYARAITPRTAALLKVHPSNYRVVGFTAEAPAREIARLAVGQHIVFIHDLGSGLIGEPEFSIDEPLVRSALEEGADLVTFSGDKLLGGPQAGIVAGRRHLIDRLASHPLLRALRPDKMTLAALEATLALHLRGESDRLPLWQMARRPLDELEDRAAELAEKLRAQVSEDTKVEAAAVASVAGGGSLPGLELPSFGLAVADGEKSSAELQRRLRYGSPPVIGRVEDDRLIIDLRTVAPADDGVLLEQLVEALKL